MSIRLAFYEVKGFEKVGFARLTDAISSSPFTDDSTSGFLLNRRSKTALDARYIEKYVVQDSFTDPFGNNHTQERIQYTELKFQLRTKRPQLIVFDINPAFKPFTGRLLEFSDFRLSITPLPLSPINLVKRFESEFESVVVYVANPQPLNISPSVIVRFAFEGSEDVRKHVKSYLKAHNTKYKSLKFQFSTASGIMKCEIKESGTLLLYGECDPLILERILALMDEILSKSEL